MIIRHELIMKDGTVFRFYMDEISQILPNNGFLGLVKCIKNPDVNPDAVGSRFMCLFNAEDVLWIRSCDENWEGLEPYEMHEN